MFDGIVVESGDAFVVKCDAELTVAKLGDELPASQPKPKMKKVEEPASFGSGPPAFGSKSGNKNNFDVFKGSPDKKQDSPDPAPQKR